MIVLTNDDGIDAPGIQALYSALTQTLTTPDRIAVVAPDRHLSGCSHQINRGGPLTIDQRSDHHWAISGTPADCVRVASHLYPELQWLVSGINDGGNLGADIYVSGTVAAAREATLLRIPALSISHYKASRAPIDWPLATERAAAVLANLMAKSLAPGQFWNVNLPSVERRDTSPQLVECPVCTQPLPTRYRVENDSFHYVGRYQERQRDRGADVDQCFTGHISASRIRLW